MQSFSLLHLALLLNLGNSEALALMNLDCIVQDDIFLYLLEHINDSYLDFGQMIPVLNILVHSVCFFRSFGLILGMLADFLLNIRALYINIFL